MFKAGLAGSVYGAIISLLITNLCIMSFDSTDIIQKYYFKADGNYSTNKRVEYKQQIFSNSVSIVDNADLRYLYSNSSDTSQQAVLLHGRFSFKSSPDDLQ